MANTRFQMANELLSVSTEWLCERQASTSGQNKKENPPTPLVASKFYDDVDAAKSRCKNRQRVALFTFTTAV